MADTLLIFDCDGVLVDSEVIYLKVERDWVSRAGLTVDHAEYVQTYSGLPAPDWQARIIEAIQSTTGRAPEARYFDEMRAHLATQFEDRLRAVAGVRPALEALTMRSCVASSSATRALHWKLRHTGLHDLFDPHIFSTELVARGKPEPDLFLHAAKTLRVSPRDCIVIEDSVNGVRAGKAADMQVIGFTGGGHCVGGHGEMLKEAGADAIAGSYEDFGRVLAGLPLQADAASH